MSERKRKSLWDKNAFMVVKLSGEETPTERFGRQYAEAGARAFGEYMDDILQIYTRVHWSVDEDNYLREHWRHMSIAGMAKMLHRPHAGVRTRLWRLRLIKSRLWTAQEEADLKALYRDGDRGQIAAFAKKMKRNMPNVTRKAHDMGLQVTRHRGIIPAKRSPKSQERLRRLERPEDERKATRVAKFRRTQQIKGHPRGYREWRTCPVCGKAFDVEHSTKQTYCSIRCSTKGRPTMTMFSRSRNGKRPDLGDIYFRSSYEANYARYLNFLIKNTGEIKRWEFEKQTFEFTKIKRGTRTYLPDFKVYFADGHIEYHEVKGWDYPKGITARKRFAKYFPHLKLVLINEEFFKAIRRQGGNKLIPGWE